MSVADYKIMAFVGTTNPEHAKAFYADTLGLRMIEDAWFAIIFDAAGTRLHIEKVQEKFTPVPFTALGWSVTNIEQVIARLSKKGVVFERFGGLQQDATGLWITPDGGGKVCWFKDPDGNLLSLSESS